MNFLQKNEKALVKSLIYGFIGGLYISILFLPREKLIPNGPSRIVHESTPFEYILDILKISITVSLLVIVLSAAYLYFKQRKEKI